MDIDEWLEKQRINGGPHGMECVGRERLNKLWMAATLEERKAMEMIDMDAFAKQIAPKLLKEMERGIMAEVREMEWADYVYDLLQDEDIHKELVKRIIAGLKGAS